MSQNICFCKEERAESWEADLLGRKDAAHQLERLIANAPGPYVIAMTSEWGSGKTFFLKAWEKDLRDRHRPCVYFNAWETDHAGDPLLALTGCITDSLEKQSFIEHKHLKTLAESASKIVAQAPGTFAKIAVGLANHYTKGVLDEVKDVLADSVKLGTDLFLKNNARRKSFAKQLEDIATEASASILEEEEDPVNGTKHFPLFVMIDELDRCRPSYVIELLENIKHLFSVPGVVFLLAIDLDQILGIIQHTFGLCVTDKKRDVRHDYLRKFIDVFWMLPSPDKFNFAFTNLKSKKMNYPIDWNPETIEKNVLYKDYDLENYHVLKNKEDAFWGIVSQIVADSAKSLRESSQIIDKFYIIYMSYKPSWRKAIAIVSMLFAPENNEAGLRELLRLRGVEVAGQHFVERYSDSLSSVATCLILVVCFGKSMQYNPSRNNVQNISVVNFLGSLDVCGTSYTPNLANLYDKLQFFDNFYFDEETSMESSEPESD